MNPEFAGLVPGLSRKIPISLPHWVAQSQSKLYQYWPQFRNRRFWTVQALVFLIFCVHTAIGELRLFDPQIPHIHSLLFVPVALFFIPVVYASLSFGFAGAVATALWCTALTLPNILIFHEGLERLGVGIQLGIIDLMAGFVGHRVDREIAARQRAEAAGTALQVSEARYRGLFASSPIAVLVVNAEGLVLEGNPAAGRLFERVPSSLSSASVADLVGPAAAERVLRTRRTDRDGAGLVLTRKDESEVYLEPILAWDSESHGEPILQIILRDATQERHRATGLRTYAN